jgi:hypothetical protein
VCVLHPSLDSFSSRYYGVLHGLLTSLFPNYHLLAQGYCPLSLGFCFKLNPCPPVTSIFYSVLKWSTRTVPDLFFVALSFQPGPSIKMGSMDRCGILFYAGSITTDMGLLLVAPAPQLFPHETFSIHLQTCFTPRIYKQFLCQWTLPGVWFKLHTMRQWKLRALWRNLFAENGSRIGRENGEVSFQLLHHIT